MDKKEELMERMRNYSTKQIEMRKRQEEMEKKLETVPEFQEMREMIKEMDALEEEGQEIERLVREDLGDEIIDALKPAMDVANKKIKKDKEVGIA
jgi:uncharacterized protein Yka (UPF0111/DUF47 family)